MNAHGHLEMLRRLGDALHERSAELGPRNLTTQQFYVHRPLSDHTSLAGSYTWLRPYSSKRWSVRDSYGSLDPGIAALWFGPEPP